MTLSGNVVIRNGNELDFCWRECIQSLLPVCDIVTVCDGESTDGTQEEIRKWMESEPKIKLCVYAWPNPVGDPDFFVKWINYCREHVKADWQIQLDADEILHENSYGALRAFIETAGDRTGICRRHNFWVDSRHIIPYGFCCGHEVVRVAHQHHWLPSDGYHPMGNTAIALAIPCDVQIFHYGFIRKRDAFYKKERILQKAFFNTYDARLEKCEKKKQNFMKAIPFSEPLIKFNGTHPQVAIKWLQERGYEL